MLLQKTNSEGIKSFYNFFTFNYLEIKNGRLYYVEKNIKLCNCCDMKIQENKYIVCRVLIILL